MRLGHVAAALGINEKTADNAIRTLGLARPVDQPTVRALGLALRAKYRYGVPLKRAFPLVREALNRPAVRKKDPLVREVFAYLPEVDRGIRKAAERYRPLPRGPGWRDPYHPPIAPRLRRHPAVRRALQWGLDLSLNQFSLSQTTPERVQAWADSVRAWHALRGGPDTVNPITLCEELAQAGVRFVTLGGAAGRLHGTARFTDDVDICYDPAADNIERLVSVLNAWHARLYIAREPEARLPFVIDRRTFRDSPALSLTTDHGRLDLLPDVARIGGYAACVAASKFIRVGAVEVQLLTLDALIQAKRAAGRPRDLEHLIELEALRPLARAAKPRRRRR